MTCRRGLKSHSEAGFSMLEVLVVVVIVGILGAIAAPGWLSFLARQQMNAARSDLMSVLRNAQQEAQNKQIAKQVDFSDTELSVTVRNESATTGGFVTVLAEGEVGDKYRLEPTSSSLVFDYDGRVDEDTTLPFAIKITTEDSSAQSCVIVTTLLGGLKPANNDLCDNFSAD